MGSCSAANNQGRLQAWRPWAGAGAVCAAFARHVGGAFAGRLVLGAIPNTACRPPPGLCARPAAPRRAALLGPPALSPLGRPLSRPAGSLLQRQSSLSARSAHGKAARTALARTHLPMPSLLARLGLLAFQVAAILVLTAPLAVRPAAAGAAPRVSLPGQCSRAPRGCAPPALQRPLGTGPAYVIPPMLCPGAHPTACHLSPASGGPPARRGQRDGAGAGARRRRAGPRTRHGRRHRRDGRSAASWILAWLGATVAMSSASWQPRL